MVKMKSQEDGKLQDPRANILAAYGQLQDEVQKAQGKKSPHVARLGEGRKHLEQMLVSLYQLVCHIYPRQLRCSRTERPSDVVGEGPSMV